jgi:hypothetical protein
MSIEIPQAGKTYVSRTEPSMVIFVVDVVVPDPDDVVATAFIVEGCDPAFKDDTDNADGIELTAEVWKKHEFRLVSR